jgi:tetratricopeptide (TPR) repeat protein
LSDLQRQAGRDFQITLWHDSDWLAKRAPIGLIRDAGQAAALAEAIGAHVVVYGSLENGAYAPRFYMKPAQGAWDDVAGPHDFGQAMPVRGTPKDDFAFLRALAARQRQLALFTIGLMYDAFGYNTDALKAFDMAASQGDGAAVADVLQYFIGREYSALGRLDEAERAFTRSLAADPRYARAWTGIGSVNMLRAEALEPAERQAHPEVLARARDAYARALALAETDGPPIQPIARVGLGYVARIEGDTLLQTADANMRAGRPADAELNTALAKFDEAIAQLGAALPELQRQKLIRLEAQAWLGLGAAHEQTATARRLLGQADAEPLTRARDAYAACARQVTRAPNDRFLRENTAALCARLRDRVTEPVNL